MNVIITCKYKCSFHCECVCVCVCVKKPHKGEDRVPTLVGTLSFARLQFWARVRCIMYTCILVKNVDTAACVASVMSMFRFFVGLYLLSWLNSTDPKSTSLETYRLLKSQSREPSLWCEGPGRYFPKFLVTHFGWCYYFGV